MMVRNKWLLLLVLQLLHGASSSMVKLNNGGFEDLVIAINPALPEDSKLIDNIKAMVTEASPYLFSATKQRFYFRTVKIIIPLTWTSKSEYKRVTIESYEKADVIVADPFLKYGDDPYTLQNEGCGEKGRYIHFTSNFLLNDSLVDVYGSRGRAFVHEWAHLRWGVFDEYNNEAPFYTAGANKAEATRCSAGITGKYIFPTGNGNYRNCRFQHSIQLYEGGCQFVPDKTQNTPASIMYMQSLDSLTEFCDNSTHNIAATNLQNKLCSYRSTWEVIKDSADFRNSSVIATPPPDPTFTLLQTQDRVVCLVLDVSGSMNQSNRTTRLKQAAEIFLVQIIETGSWAGIVTFHSVATTVAPLQQIVNEDVRKHLASRLPTTASGGTTVCAGVREGFQVIKARFSTEGSEIVLLTDGEDGGIGSCFSEVEASGSVIHAIALGPSAAVQLNQLADLTGGLKFYAGDGLDSSALIDAFSAISSATGDLSHQSIQLESRSESVAPAQFINGIVSIDKTIGNDTFFVVTWSVIYTQGIFLTDPKRKRYKDADFEIDRVNTKTARLRINGTAETGDWHYQIQNAYQNSQVISLTVTSRAASADVPPVSVKAYVNNDANAYPRPMIIYAEVSQGSLPVLNAKVIATIEPQTGTATDVDLLDNGSGADIIQGDGIYSRYFTAFTVNGRYGVKVRVEGKDKTARLARRLSRALYVPGYVENGKVTLNAPRPEVSDEETQPSLGNFNRISSGGSFVMLSVPPVGTNPDVFPPCKINDLDVQLEDDTFLLSWTAPGDDYDVGIAERYEIKTSDNPLELRSAVFQNAKPVDIAGLTPDFAGAKQSFQFKSENFPKKNGTTFYFAIRAVDDNNNVGEASNIARAAVLRFTSPSVPPTASAGKTTTAGKTTSTIPQKEISQIDPNTTVLLTIIVCVSLIIICIIVSTTVCILNKRKNRCPQTGM